MQNRVILLVLLVFSVVTPGLSAKANRERIPPTTPAGPSPIPSPPANPPVVQPVAPPPLRYYQTSTEIQYSYDDEHSMANSGCCFMACLGVAQTHAQRTLTADQINSLRAECFVSSPQLLGSDFYVTNISGVINRAFAVLGVNLRATVTGRTTVYKTEYVCDSTLLFGEQGDADGGYHFVEGDQYGIEIWNPHPVVTITKIISITYIKIEGYR